MNGGRKVVRYHGSLTEAHGVYLEGWECTCQPCRSVWIAWQLDPAGGDYWPDIRWTLRDQVSGVVVLEHVRPESFTTITEPGVAA